VQLVPIGLSDTHALRASEAAPVVFGLFLVVIMLLLPRGAPQLFRALGGLSNRIRNAS